MLKMTAILMPSSILIWPICGILIASLYSPVHLRYQVLGFGRSSEKTVNVHGHELRVIPNTLYVEDLHYHPQSGLLFGASEADAETRKHWFPPTASLKNPETLGQGTIVLIDPETFNTTRLPLHGFSGPFITHGIDVWSPCSDPKSIFIFAVNHLPNPAFWARSDASTIEPKAHSQIELFHYRVGETQATHLRSIWHPLIQTPSDIYAVKSNEFLVTNDHLFREGSMRLVEDLGWNLAPWSNIIHVNIDLKDSPGADDMKASTGVTASVALRGQQNVNGLGHGASRSDVLVGRTSAGVMLHASLNPVFPSELQIMESVQLGSTIDNPTYFADPYVEQTGRDASGYVLAGLLNAAGFPTAEGKDPVIVWMVQPLHGQLEGEIEGDWNRTIVFQDDGNKISSASTAVVIAIHPAENQGRKQAWLFVTGPLSKAVVAAKIDL